MRTVAELLDLKGRLTLITGGAGYIGRAIAETVGELGSDIILLDRPGTPLVDTAGELEKRWQVKVTPLGCNLESEPERKSLLKRLHETCPRLDILVNNAAFVGDSALTGWVAPFAEQSVATWRRALEVNLTAVFELCQGCAPLLRAGTGASIINIASIYGVSAPDYRLYQDTAMGNPAAYAASKGGLVQLSRWLSTTLAPDIRVNVISPGGVARGQPEAFVKRYQARTPLGRMATEEDFKGAVAYLATDLSCYMTGQNLIVDGGWTVW